MNKKINDSHLLAEQLFESVEFCRSKQNTNLDNEINVYSSVKKL